MAKALPLPRVEDLPEVVLFHRRHPSDQRLILQVPVGPETAETYVIRLDQPDAPTGEYDPRTDHKGWVKRLPNSQALMDRLSYEMNVAYYPSRGGTVMDLDNPDEIPWSTIVVALARLTHREDPFESRFLRRRVLGRYIRRPALQMMLQHRPGRASW